MSIQSSTRPLNRYRAAGMLLLASVCSAPTQAALALECSAEVLVQESRGSWVAQDSPDGPTVRIVSLPEDAHLRAWGLQSEDVIERVRTSHLGCEWTVARGSNPQSRSFPVHPRLAPGEIDASIQTDRARYILNGNYTVAGLLDFIAARLMRPATLSCFPSQPNMSIVSRSPEPWDAAMLRAQAALESVGCTMTITDRAVIVQDLVVEP